MKKISSLSATQIRTRRGIFTLGITTLLSGLVFVVLPKDPQNTSFGFLLGGEWELFRQWDVNSRTGAAIFVAVALACTAY
ncbi:MAG: hypothetical protein RLZZ19_327, partial [Actinomycetota bacterium]